MERDKKRPGNYLSLDGGSDWLSAIPALLTLEEIMRRLQRDLDLPEAPLPCKVFDLIIASGHAALVAFLIGKMRLMPSQAIEAYKKLEPALSVGPTEDKEEQERNMEAFKKLFTEVMEQHGFDEHSLILSKENDESDTKIVICTQNTANPPSLYPIRSYLVRGARPASCTILQAACASIASLDRFPPVTIGYGHKKVTLINAVPNYANPMKVLLPEARRIFGDEGNVAAIVSIGSGKGAVQDRLDTHDSLVVDMITSKCEQVHAEVLTLLHKLFIYFRLNHNQIPGDMANRSSINAQLSAYFQEEEIRKHLEDAVESMAARQKGGNLRDINLVYKKEITLKPRPSVAQSFVGREDILEAMKQRGSGKTQIALKFANEFEDKCPDSPIYFLNASSEENLRADFETVIRSQGVIYRSQSCDDALAWLAAKERKWCLILDNADDPSLNLFPYIPKSVHGNVIITTRNYTHALLSPDDHHAVEGLPMADAIMLVLKMAHYETTAENQSLAQAIVKELGSLPLALAHAGAYIFVDQCLPTYLDMYRTSRAQFLDSNQALPHDYQLSVGTTVQMSLNKLPQAARDTIVVFSYLDASLIPLQIISTSAERRFRLIDGQSEDEALDTRTVQHADTLMAIFCPNGEWFEYDFNTSIQKGLEYSLLQITTRGDDRFFSMHVLVQTYLQSNLYTVQSQHPGQLVIRLLGSAIMINDHYMYQAFNRLFAPHLRTITIEDVVEAGDHVGFGQVLEEQGSTQLSTAHRERCLELRRRALGDEHAETLRAMGNLALSYSELGKNQEALNLREKVLKVRIRILGDDHLDTVRAMGNLAASYSGLGRSQEALDLEEKVLELRKRISGDDHPDTLRAMGNLAASYSEIGRNQEAVNLEEKVLALQKQILGDEHPSTLLAMGNLASSYGEVGKNQEALNLKEKVLELRIRISGDEHPDTVRAMGNLATSYTELGRHQEALSLQEKVLELRKQTLGYEHPSILLAMGNLALTYSELGRNQEALNLREEVLALRKQVSGDEHPSTLRAMGNLAASYSELGRSQEALDLEEKVLALRKQILGEEHPTTLLTMANLATSYSDTGRNQEALDLEEKVLALRKQVSGEDHPDTMLAMANLAASYSEMGRNKEALNLKEKVLALRRQTSGDEHPDTMLAMANLSTSYRKLGRNQEALDLRAKVLALRTRISGDDHPETIRAMSNLARSYNEMGRLQDALYLKENLLALRKHALGDEHPDALLEMSNVAECYSELGRYQESFDLREKVSALLTRTLGDDHPSTLLAMADLAMSYCDLGRNQDALDMGEGILALRKQISGDEHPSTLLAMRNLIVTLNYLGMSDRAIVLLQVALPLHERVRGVDHPDTVSIRECLEDLMESSDDEGSLSSEEMSVRQSNEEDEAQDSRTAYRDIY